MSLEETLLAAMDSKVNVRPSAILAIVIGKIDKKLWQIACNSPNLPNYFTVKAFTVQYADKGSYRYRYS